MIKLLIVDDIPETRDHLTRLIGLEREIDVIGVDTGEQLCMVWLDTLVGLRGGRLFGDAFPTGSAAAVAPRVAGLPAAAAAVPPGDGHTAEAVSREPLLHRLGGDEVARRGPPVAGHHHAIGVAQPAAIGGVKSDDGVRRRLAHELAATAPAPGAAKPADLDGINAGGKGRGSCRICTRTRPRPWR